MKTEACLSGVIYLHNRERVYFISMLCEVPPISDVVHNIIQVYLSYRFYICLASLVHWLLSFQQVRPLLREGHNQNQVHSNPHSGITSFRPLLL
jgi:hypothetical protein